MPNTIDGYKHVFHLYVIKSDKRNSLKNYLSEMGIETVINYPVALPFLPAYNKYNYSTSDFPISFSNQDKILSLPIFPEITENQINYVIDKVKNFFNK